MRTDKGTRTHNSLGRARVSRCRARAQAQRARHAQVGAGHVHTKALCRPGLFCRNNSTGKALAHDDRGYAVGAPWQWYLASRYRCPLSASTEPEKCDPGRMVKNGPHERTGASCETCYSKATRVGETVARMHATPLKAPLARRAPIPRFFWFLGCHAATPLALLFKLQQEHIQVVHKPYMRTLRHHKTRHRFGFSFWIVCLFVCRTATLLTPPES